MLFGGEGFFNTIITGPGHIILQTMPVSKTAMCMYQYMPHPSSTLLYWALASLSHVIFGWLPGFLSQLQLFQIGIPAFTGLYFDWFGGCIQAFIFCTLTTIFIKRAAGEE